MILFGDKPLEIPTPCSGLERKHTYALEASMDTTEYNVDLIVASHNGDPEDIIRQLLIDAGVEIVALNCYEKESF